MPKIQVIVPTYNDLPLLRYCIAGLEAQEFRDFEVLFCVDGSTDDTEAFLTSRTFSFPHKVLCHPDRKNHGREATRNLALPYLNAPYLLLLDSDLIPSPHCIKAHLDLLLHSPNSLSMGKIVFVSPQTWEKYRFKTNAYKYDRIHSLPIRYFRTGNLCMPTHFFTNVGGQDPNYPTYGGGDFEMGWRIHNLFHPKLLFNPFAITCSFAQTSLDTALNRLYNIGKMNFPYLLKKHPHIDPKYLHIRNITANSISSKLFRALFQYSVAKWIYQHIESLPFSYLFMKYLVGYQLKAGFYGLPNLTDSPATNPSD
jgi:glycosyltransferase involved in cell wall biosynthesis